MGITIGDGTVIAAALTVAYGSVQTVGVLVRMWVVPKLNGWGAKIPVKELVTREQFEQMQSIYPKLTKVEGGVARLENAVCGTRGCAARQTEVIHTQERIARHLESATTVLGEIKAMVGAEAVRSQR